MPDNHSPHLTHIYEQLFREGDIAVYLSKEPMEAKYKKIAREIKNYLKEKGQLEKVDTNLINEVAYNYQIADEAKKEISEKGLLVNVRATGAPLYQTNQAVSIYNQSIKNITVILTKLGITTQERSKLKLVSKEEDDGFEDGM